MIEFKMPSLGADMEAGTLVEWLVKPGDTVKRGDIIAEVDTQKGLIDIEVFEEGTISELLVKENEKVPVGTVMALIQPLKETARPTEAILPAPIKEEKKEVLKKEPLKKQVPAPAHFIRASPLAKKMAAEKGIELNTIRGSGEGGAITREDVEKALGEQVAPAEARKKPATETIRMAVAAAMTRSNREIPHYYLETRVDMSQALAWLTEANKRRSVKQRLLPVVLLIRAVAKALLVVPQLNAYWENGLQLKTAINIGFVVSLRTGGLMIPAITAAHTSSLDQLMATLNDIIPRARAMKLRSSELSESTITITSLGEGNVETVYGVIYPPQVAIVGLGSITEQPWAEKGMLDVRPVMTITLAADHRATDGATGSRFLMLVKEYLQNPVSLDT